MPETVAAIACPAPRAHWWAWLRSSTLGDRLASGAFWSLVGAVGSNVLTLVASIIIARLLTRSGFGEYGIIQSTIGLFAIFATFGLGMTSAKYVAEYRATDPDRAGRIMGLSGVVALATGTLGGLALCAAAPWLAAHALAAPHLAGRLRIGAVSIFLTALNGAQAGALSGLEAFRAMAWVNLANGLVALPVLVAGTYLGSLAGTLWANCVVQVVAWLLYHRALRAEAHRRGVPFAWTGCLREWEVLHRFSLPAIFSNALVALVTWYCYTLLINRAGGYAEMGIFNAANQWRTAILFLPGALATIVLPLLSNLRGAGDHGAYRLIFWANVYINALVGLAAVVPVALLAPWIMARYGAGFREGWPVLVLLALSAVPAGVNGVVGQAIASAGKMWLGCLFNGLWAAAMLGSAVSATGRWGAAGLAGATLLSYVLHTGWQALYVGSLRGAPAPPPEGTAAGAPLREDML